MFCHQVYCICCFNLYKTVKTSTTNVQIPTNYAFNIIYGKNSVSRAFLFYRHDDWFCKNEKYCYPLQCMSFIFSIRIVSIMFVRAVPDLSCHNI